jgi:AcrR family transcriptional regulator
MASRPSTSPASTRPSARAPKTKGERTRKRIVERAAVLFNTRGVAGASMADVSLATGLEKGGVYNHFVSKEELALEAFDYAAALVRERLETAAKSAKSPLARLRAILDVHRDIHERPFLSGGCPLLNTAIEADDTNPALRARARKGLEHWQRLIGSAVEDAVAARELQPVDARAFASTAVAALEGGVMLSALYRDPSRVRTVVDHLQRWVDTLER